MDAITVTRPVVVLVRVTNGYRRLMSDEVRAALGGLEREEVRLAHARRTAPDKDVSERRERLRETKTGLLDRLKAIEELADGTLVLFGRLESLVEIRVGARWQDIAGVEVVLEDGRVAEIRPADGSGGDWWKST